MKTFDPAETATIVAGWTDAHVYSPAPRHRRRLMLEWLKPLEFSTLLDAGCAHADFLRALAPVRPATKLYGCDLCRELMEHNSVAIPGIGFATVDLTKEPFPGVAKFDMVVTSEVLEHIEDWQLALRNLLTYTNRYVLVTVPAGKRYAIDQRIGHFKHYTIKEVADVVESEGFKVIKARYWGFPFHTLYKWSINAFSPEKIYSAFGERPYGPFKKAFCHFLYALFYINDLFPSGGGQLMLLAERPRLPKS
jgi:cyclopropane fatty-acyl-phospholipid synthase-like methyltransferase